MTLTRSLKTKRCPQESGRSNFFPYHHNGFGVLMFHHLRSNQAISKPKHDCRSSISSEHDDAPKRSGRKYGLATSNRIFFSFFVSCEAFITWGFVRICRCRCRTRSRILRRPRRGLFTWMSLGTCNNRFGLIIPVPLAPNHICG